MSDDLEDYRADLEDYNRRLDAAYQTLRTAFEGAGVTLREQDHGELRRLAYWINGSMHEGDRFQDPRSRELMIAVEAKAASLREALAAAWEYSGFAEAIQGDGLMPNDDTDKVNCCETFFSSDPEAECTWSVMAIQLSAWQSMERGRKQQGAGRPPQYAYYRFVRDLHYAYSLWTNSKGFYEKSGGVHGPFIKLVRDAQSILPEAIRVKSPTLELIGNRVLQAFGASGSPPAPPPQTPYQPSYRILSDDETGDIPETD